MTASRRQEYADHLTRVYKKPVPWTYWGYRPPPRPANTVSWERTDSIAVELDRALASFDPNERLVLLRRMERQHIAVMAATLTNWLTSELQPDRVAAILAALRDHPAADVRRHLKAVVTNAGHSMANRQMALTQVRDGIDDSNAEELLTLSQGASGWSRPGRCAAAAGQISPARRGFAIGDEADLLAPGSSSCCRRSARRTRRNVDRGTLLTLLQDQDPRVRRSAASRREN